MVNILKLARALSGSLPGFNRVENGDFIQKIENDLDITWVSTSTFLAEAGGSSTEFYVKALTEIQNHEPGGAGILESVISAFGLQKVIEKKQTADMVSIVEDAAASVSQDKPGLLADFQSRIAEIEKLPSPKAQGNAFEELCEWFLLQSSYFELGPRGEVILADGTEKIDRLLRLKRPIGSLFQESGYAGYVVLESKYVKDEQAPEGARQITSYLGRLSKYGVANLGIAIVKTGYKDSYKTLIKKHLDGVSSGGYFVSLITVDEIEKLLSNAKGYEGMRIDEFIERSFIQWL